MGCGLGEGGRSSRKARMPGWKTRWKPTVWPGPVADIKEPLPPTSFRNWE